MRRGLILILVGLLWGCRPESKAPPAILDVNLTSIARNDSRLATATPPTNTPTNTPSMTPTSTEIVVTPQLPSPTFPVDRTDYINETMPKGTWSTAFFSTLDGQRFTFNDFAGQVVVVQTLSTLCTPCEEQTRELKTSAEYLAGIQYGGKITFVFLSIDALDRAEDLTAYLENNWTTNASLQTLVGFPAEDLKAEISRTFDPDFISSTSGGVFFVDKSGFGQLLTRGFIPFKALRDTIIHLVGGEGVDAPTSTPDIPLPTPEAPTEAVTETPTEDLETATPES